MVPTTQEEVFLDWYRSEHRQHPEVRAAIEQALANRTESERAQFGLRALRGALLQHKISLPQTLPDGTQLVTLIAFFDVCHVDWFATEMKVGALGDATPIRAFASFATVRDVAAQHPGFQNCAVDLTHRPILLTEAHEGRLILADGYHRTAGLLQRNHQEPVSVFLGVCPTLADWAHYR